MVFQKIKSLGQRIGSYQVPIYAGNATFFIVLAAFPSLMLILSLLQFTPYTVDDFNALLIDVLPSVLAPLVTYITDEMFSLNAGAVISITAITTLWSASRGVLGVINGLNAIYGASETRSYLFKRLLALAYMVMFIVAILLTLILYVFGRKLQAMVIARFPSLTGLTIAVLQFKYILILGYLTILFTLIFKVFPNRHTKLRHAFPGALIASLGWLGFSALFSVYVDRFSNYSRIYGSLTTIILMMLWLYFCMCILFFGGVINQYLDRCNVTLRALLPRRKKKSA
jgi:membrane protein